MIDTTELQELTEIVPGLYFVQAPSNGRFPFCNGFLITGSRTVLIDAGLGDELITRLDRLIGIDVLLVSHSHPDHILGWHHLSHRELVLPAETPDSVHNLLSLGARFTGSIEDGRYWAGLIGGLGLKAVREPDGRYSNGDILDFGTIRLRAIHAPGHLDDHYCFYEENYKLLLSTDIDFTSFGPWYANPEGDIRVFIGAIREVMNLEKRIVVSSHRSPIHGPATKEFEEFLSAFERQKDEVCELCRQPVSLDELTAISPFYRDRLPWKRLQSIFESRMIRKNLDILMEEGRISEERGLYRACD